MYDPYEASLDKSVNEDEDTSLGDLIESDSKNEIENIIINEELKKDVLDALETLNEQERKIIKLRFGIGDEKNIPHTLRETGKIMNISYERVRIVERKALNKLYVLSHEIQKLKN